MGTGVPYGRVYIATTCWKQACVAAPFLSLDRRGATHFRYSVSLTALAEALPNWQVWWDEVKDV